MNPYESYKRQMVNTMTQADLLNMLYDGAIKQIGVAKSEIDKKNFQSMDLAIDKARKIVRYLKGALDFRYPISRELSSLYDYFDRQLGVASVKKDSDVLQEVSGMLGEMKETFVECEKINRSTDPMRRAGMATAMGSNV